MADTGSIAGISHGPDAGDYEPDVPITVSPILGWSPRPGPTLRHIASMMLPQGMIWVGIAAVAWNFFTYGLLAGP